MSRNNTVSVIATESSNNQSHHSNHAVNESENQPITAVSADLPVSSVTECEKNSNSQQLSGESLNERFMQKMRSILCCGICSELRRCPIYQCKYGHLICAGCLNDILSESRVQNEIASCPGCQTTITKELCFRNVAVEKTISELPVVCRYCSKEFLPINFAYHENVSCGKRPAFCPNKVIGCAWQGPIKERIAHESSCPQLEANGYEILKSLESTDQQYTSGLELYNKLIELLSFEKMVYTDLQLKMVKTENKNVIFETSKFSSLENQWMIRACCHADVSKSTCLTYQLLVKSKLSGNLHLKYFLLKGPYNNMELKPNVYQFRFSEKSDESPFHILEVPYIIDQETFYSAKRINIRIFMFLVS